MRAIESRIASRALSRGDRLPSVRRFAETMGVSTSTVVDAYGRLEAAGIIRGRKGSGFYVVGTDLLPFGAEASSQRDRTIDPFWVSRQSLDAPPASLRPGCGWLPADWMPIEALRKGLRALSRGEECVLSDYATTRGAVTLRRLLLARFADEGLYAGSEQLMLTGSGTQAIDLVCRLLLQPGDTVLVDDPCYFNFHALLRAHRVNVCGVPMTPSGPDVAAFEQAALHAKARIYITNSALQNPTGATMSHQTAHRVLAAAVAHGVTIVEDDIFADLEPSLSARFAILDGLDNVIRIGSFSKTISASVRCAYIAAKPEWIESLLDLQVATGFTGASPVAAQLMADVLQSGTYRKHMTELRRRLIRAREFAAEQLASIGIVPWMMPRGGFFLWCRLPEGCDSAAVAHHCMERDIVLAPGDVFSSSRSATSFMRFNVTQMSDDRLLPALRAAIDASSSR